MSENYRSRAALQGVEPADVAAMVALQETDPETMRAIVTMANVMCRGERDADVASLAVVIAPAMWQARRDETVPVVAVVAGAVRRARARVGAVRQGDREWMETYGDGADAAALVDEGDARPMGSPWCPRPDRGLTIGAADVLAAWVAMGEGETDREWLESAADAWLQWSETATAGRPLALQGAVAWSRGLKSSDAGYRVARTATIDALETVAGLERADVLAAMPDGERPGWSIPTGVGRVSMSGRVVTREPLEWEDVLQVRVAVDALGYPSALGYGETVRVVETVRRLSDGERARVESPAMGAPGRTIAPETADDHAAGFAGEGVHLPVRKVAPSPRKRGGSGSTGPTVPARLSR